MFLITLNNMLKRSSRMHWGVVLLVLMICILGFVLLYGAAGGSFHPYVVKQIPRFVIGIFAMWFIAIVNIKHWYDYAYLFYALAVGLLVAVYVNGHVGMGAQRWLNLGFFALHSNWILL